MAVERIGNKMTGQVFSIKSKKRVADSAGGSLQEPSSAIRMEIRNQMNEIVFSANIAGIGLDEDEFLNADCVESDGTVKRHMFVLGSTYFVHVF